MKKHMSVEQVEANRANALKSTGPKTAEGKSMSRLNATRHGILSREVVLRGENRGEREREFASLYRWYREYLEPVGPLEEMLVERVANVYRGSPSRVAEKLQGFLATVHENQEGVSAEQSRAEWPQRVVAFLDGELGYFGKRLVLMEGREKREAQTIREASRLPSRSKLDKIQRYEGSLERQLYRAMNQLERLQRVRRGERIPPPWVVSQ
jgi:hypothetical protein